MKLFKRKSKEPDVVLPSWGTYVQVTMIGEQYSGFVVNRPQEHDWLVSTDVWWTKRKDVIWVNIDGISCPFKLEEVEVLGTQKT